jgi:hypothetical protein
MRRKAGLYVVGRESFVKQDFQALVSLWAPVPPTPMELKTYRAFVCTVISLLNKFDLKGPLIRAVCVEDMEPLIISVRRLPSC